MSHTYIADLARQAVPPERGIHSQTLLDNASLKAVLFGFAAGEELSEHTASRPAVLHFISGTARVMLGDEQVAAAAGTWVHMPAKLPHGIHADTPLVMLLLLLKVR